ncbi:MAG: SusE domain-containing protein [Bacteroidetes bacterium]|nr:SusE domain-containing protein [Bacteroidota bacterium]
MTRKYLTFILASALLLHACSDDSFDPVLTLEGGQVITNPSTGSSYILTADTKDDVFEKITWTATDFNLTNLVNTTYRLQMDVKGNNFSAPVLLTNTKELEYEITVGNLNSKLLLMGLNPDEAAEIELRVVANKDQKLDDIISEIVTINVTPYGATVTVKPVYLLGSATLAGWDNLAALPMTYLDGGRYEIVTTLNPGADKYFKFISVLGQWAPQWGTDATGLPEGGPLVYRPTESEPDPPAILAPALASQYKIIVDTAQLTYEVFEYGDIYLLGGATLAGWDNTIALPMTKVSEGKYTITTTLDPAGQFWKIIDERGAWAPQWGTDANGTPDGGALAYRPTESEPDPPAIPAPAAAGLYKIDVDIVNLTYTVTAQ